MRQAMEDGVSEVLSDVVEDVSQAISRNIGGTQLLHELLSAPWLHALLKVQPDSFIQDPCGTEIRSETVPFITTATK
ncbi:hypothetical protein PAMP_003355 [Pampus punctatissimus]